MKDTIPSLWIFVLFFLGMIVAFRIDNLKQNARIQSLESQVQSLTSKP